MREKSRILIVTTAYLPQMGGSELAIKNITERLPEFDFDLITSRFSSSIPSYEKIGNLNVYRAGNSLSRFSFLLPKNFLPIAVFLKARKLMSEHGPYRLIHAYQASQAAGGGWLLKWFYPEIPFVVTVQEGKILRDQSWLMRFFRYLIFRKVDTVTVISSYLKHYVRSQNPKVPVSIIPNGVDLHKFTPDGVHDPKILITTGRLVKKNGTKDLISAMALVKKHIPGARLHILADGEEKEALKKLSASLGLVDTVEFLGEVSHDLVPRHLSQASIFVRPSLSEGLGSSFLEAMASGLAVIGTPVGGIPDFLKDGETGLFCEPGNPQSIAGKMIEIMENDGLKQRLIENGRKLVEERYNWDIIAGEFRKIYGA